MCVKNPPKTFSCHINQTMLACNRLMPTYVDTRTHELVTNMFTGNRLLTGLNSHVWTGCNSYMYVLLVMLGGLAGPCHGQLQSGTHWFAMNGCHFVVLGSVYKPSPFLQYLCCFPRLLRPLLLAVYVICLCHCVKMQGHGICGFSGSVFVLFLICYF